MTEGELAVIHVAGPWARGFQACSRCGHVFHDYRDQQIAVPVDDPHDPMDTHWPVGEEVLVLGGYSALTSGLRDDRDTSDEVRCAAVSTIQ